MGAYNFVNEVLVEIKKRRTSNHVDAHELLEVTRRYSIEKHGMLAKDILNELGIRNTRDIGNIVYDMIDCGLVGKLDSDKIEDFDNGYDFDEVFDVVPVFDYKTEKKDFSTSYMQRNCYKKNKGKDRIG